MEGASNVPASSGDYHLNITTETAREFRSMMRRFLAETECEVVALIERSGAVIGNELKPNAAQAAPDPDDSNDCWSIGGIDFAGSDVPWRGLPLDGASGQ